MKRTNIDHTEILRKELQDIGRHHQDPTLHPRLFGSPQVCSKPKFKEIINRSFATRDSERDEQIAIIRDRNRIKNRTVQLNKPIKGEIDHPQEPKESQKR
jgi:hypothetical protein